MTVSPYQDDDDNWDDDETPDDEGIESTIPCPSCGREMFEDSPRCPHCERYISDDDRSRPSYPVWVIATAVICLATALAWIFRVF
jgi:uncharacterized OB-fold protein